MESSGEKLDEPKGGGAVSLTYSTVVTVSTEDRTVRILFENPSKSTKDTSLQLTVNGQNEGEELLIAESELIPAGYKLAQMNLKDKVDLDPGKYEGNLKAVSYTHLDVYKRQVREFPKRIFQTFSHPDFRQK